MLFTNLRLIRRLKSGNEKKISRFSRDKSGTRAFSAILKCTARKSRNKRTRKNFEYLGTESSIILK